MNDLTVYAVEMLKNVCSFEVGDLLLVGQIDKKMDCPDGRDKEIRNWNLLDWGFWFSFFIDDVKLSYFISPD